MVLLEVSKPLSHLAIAEGKIELRSFSISFSEFRSSSSEFLPVNSGRWQTMALLMRMCHFE